MAEKRTCPRCGADWYSADSGGVWICECGVVLPPEKKIPPARAVM